MRVKTFNEACKVMGVNPKKLPQVKMLPKEHQKSVLAFYMLTIIVSAINTDKNGKTWKPNWNDTSQTKYHSWFKVAASEKKPSGFGFSDTYYDYWFTYTYVGSRLCFSNSNDAIYAGKKFAKLFKEYLLIP